MLPININVFGIGMMNVPLCIGFVQSCTNAAVERRNWYLGQCGLVTWSIKKIVNILLQMAFETKNTIFSHFCPW